MCTKKLNSSDLEEYLHDIFLDRASKTIGYTGKGGAIMFQLNLMQLVADITGKPFDIEESKKKLEDTLEDGIYTISENGIRLIE